MNTNKTYAPYGKATKRLTVNLDAVTIKLIESYRDKQTKLTGHRPSASRAIAELLPKGGE
ncbi:hypothetical protein BCU93_13540 [Vibrio breoganii]|uniref:hypothetical protein n=1 Tax=Vibrio breoganii TaxID=553239 RepID=UPI000C83FD0A|nr:hypothetical protein [Vibrio breoganii]PMG38565.1 hypothetical protein BCU93_13540 [Vibrio breoganii]